MSAPILTEKHGEDLNGLVQQLIDPRLFLLCNYEPTVCHVISEDGRYWKNAQDLYKFAIDTCPIVKRHYDFLRTVWWPDAGKWESLQRKIQVLRTVFGHNISEKDGMLSAETMDEYLLWVRSVIGKREPETLEDYVLLNKKLAEMAEQLRSCFESFIRCVANEPDRRSIVDKWIDNILFWYTHNTKVDIYKGYLLGTYTAKASAAQIDVSTDNFKQYRAKNVRDWIARTKTFPLEQQIGEIEVKIVANENMIAGRNLRIPLPPQAVANLRLEVEKMKKEQSRLQCELDNTKPSETEKRFYNDLQRQLLQTKEYLDKEGEKYTLLPQDFLVADITRVFDQIPIPGRRGRAR